jgi:DNA-binding beta-propeller fold protein YncE
MALGTVGDTVTPIDLATGKALKPIKVGLGPQGIAISPDGTTAYVTDAGAIPSLSQAGPPAKTVTPIDLATDAAGRAIPVGNGPEAITVTPGGTAFVANTDSESVTPIDLTSDTSLAPIAVNGAPVALISTSQTVFVLTVTSGSGGEYAVTPIDVTTDAAGSPIRVPRDSQYMAIAPGGKTAWVTSLGGYLTPINLVTRTAGHSIAVAGGPYALVVINVAQTRTTSPSGVTTTTTKSAKKKKKAV